METIPIKNQYARILNCNLNFIVGFLILEVIESLHQKTLKILIKYTFYLKRKDTQFRELKTILRIIKSH